MHVCMHVVCILQSYCASQFPDRLPACPLYSTLQAVSPMELLRFCREIVAGMVYLSQKGFVHRDLAARNVLLDSDNTCKVSVSTYVPSVMSQVSVYVYVTFTCLYLITYPSDYLRLLTLACHVLCWMTAIT